MSIDRWWVEINTAVPGYTYHLGPFYNLLEAAEYRIAFIKDLIEEGASGITFQNVKS